MREERPYFIQDDDELTEYLEFLDDLRESGVTNMFAAGPYIEEQFSISSKEAKQVLIYWMTTFGDRHPK